MGDLGGVVAVAVFVVDEEEEDAQQEADGAHADVGDAQEGVLPAHPGDGAQDHPLPALKAPHRIIWVPLVKEEDWIPPGLLLGTWMTVGELKLTSDLCQDTVHHLQGVVAARQRGMHVAPPLDDPVQLPERGQGGGPHPHDEILVDESVVVRVGVQLEHGPAPVHRLRRP